MSEPINRLPPSPNGREEPASARPGFRLTPWQVFQVVQARLRFIAGLAVIGTVIGFWDTITGYYEKWTRPLSGPETAANPDTEYFCPMHPFIVRDNPKEICPICHMDLARRKKGAGEPEPLPAGTVSRVQLTPYRVVLAGVQTAEVGWLPLSREITTFGSVEFDETKLAHVATRQKGRIVKLFANYTGQHVEKGDRLATLDVRYSQELMATLEDLRRARESGNREFEQLARQRLRVWDIGKEATEEFLRTGKAATEFTVFAPITGHITRKYQREGNFVDDGTPLYDVADLSSVWIEAQVFEVDQSLLQTGLDVTATTLGLPGEVFHGKLDFVYPHLDEASRTLTVRYHLPNPGHHLRPGMYATVKIEVPPARIGTIAQALKAGRPVMKDSGVLAVPDSAVIDTGNLKVVYRESAPNTYEGVAVRLGPRMTQPDNPTAFYAVLDGLSAHDRVVVNGAFLIDAETRLNPSAGSIYFGGSGSKTTSSVAVRPSTPEDESDREKKVKAGLAKLSADDRKLAEAQKFCPVLQTNRLGSMGTPVKVLLEGQPVFLCCAGCEDKAKADPRKTLQTVERLRKGRVNPPAPTPATSKEEAKIRAALDKLNPEDRKLAEAQRFCAVQSENRLGSMGKPIKVMLKGQPVFLCCEACQEDAEAAPDRTLATVRELQKRMKDER
jgi:Cu(I)/Ag(I) efflux system membrane fusion protein